MFIQMQPYNASGILKQLLRSGGERIVGYYLEWRVH